MHLSRQGANITGECKIRIYYLVLFRPIKLYHAILIPESRSYVEAQMNNEEIVRGLYYLEVL